MKFGISQPRTLSVNKIESLEFDGEAAPFI